MPFERVLARELGPNWDMAEQACGQHYVFGLQYLLALLVLDFDRILPRRFVVFDLSYGRVKNNVEVHDLRVVLDPIGNMLLVEPAGPIAWESQERIVIRVDWGVRFDRFVSSPPRVTEPRRFVHDQVREVQVL